jgi:hypothetical protein
MLTFGARHPKRIDHDDLAGTGMKRSQTDFKQNITQLIDFIDFMPDTLIMSYHNSTHIIT